MSCSRELHDKHRAAAMENFYNCFGDERFWNSDEQAMHDRMLAKIDINDGYDPVVDGRTIAT